jgi:hypothetical protein
MELKKIALELLEKYRDAQTTVIWEYSGDIEIALQVLSDECDAYLKAIEVNSNAKDQSAS